MQIVRIGLDLAKYVFEIHGVDAHGKTVVRKTLRRHAVSAFFANLPPCLVGMEASNGAHFWAKTLLDLGHDVRLISPQFVTPYVKSNKNDRNDAEAICEAVGRPNMRFVPVKSAEQLAVQAVHRIRTRLVADRVRLVNQVRGLLGEHGIVVAKDIGNLRRALAGLGDNEDRALNPMVRALMGELREELTELDARIAGYDRKISRALSQQRDLPASRQGRRDRSGDRDSAGRRGRRPKLCRPQTSFQRLERDIYGVISDARTLFVGVVSFADFAPKGRLTRKLAHTVNRTAPIQAFMRAVPIVVGDPLRELFADVGRFGVGSVPELLQYRSLHTLHFAIQVRGARRYWPKPDGFVHQSALNFLGEELSASVSLNALD